LDSKALLVLWGQLVWVVNSRMLVLDMIKMSILCVVSALTDASLFRLIEGLYCTHKRPEKRIHKIRSLMKLKTTVM